MSRWKIVTSTLHVGHVAELTHWVNSLIFKFGLLTWLQMGVVDSYVLEITCLMLLNGLGLLKIVDNQIKLCFGCCPTEHCLGIIFRNCCLLRLVALNLFYTSSFYKLLDYLKLTINERIPWNYLEKNKLRLLRRIGYPSKYNQIHLFHFICHHSTLWKTWCSSRHNGSRQCTRGSYKKISTRLFQRKICFISFSLSSWFLLFLFLWKSYYHICYLDQFGVLLWLFNS